MAIPLHIAVVGCGRLGGMLAERLSSAGHSIVVIDRRESSFDKLGPGYTGFKLIGDAVELHILREGFAQLREGRPGSADCLFAVTTSDNTNLMVAQVAREIFQVPKVVARVFDPPREGLYRELGIDTISPTKLTADAFMQALNGQG